MGRPLFDGSPPGEGDCDATAFVNALPAAAVAVIVRAPYPESATFGGQLARGRFPLAGRDDQRVLAAAMLEAVDQQMRRTGIGWVEADFGLLLDDPAVLARLPDGAPEKTSTSFISPVSPEKSVST